MYVCMCCGRVSVLPDKTCQTYDDPDETYGCSQWTEDQYDTLARRRLQHLIECENNNIELRQRILQLEADKQILIDRLARIEQGEA